MSARLALLVGAALLCGGCQVTTDIGKECVLVAKATTGGASNTRDIMVSELQEGQDFISFGSVECEDLICVRDAEYQQQMTAEEKASPTTTPAKGYCSKACVADPSLNSCAVTSSEAEASVKERMTCRALLLDQKALDDMRANDPAGYRLMFGDNNSPYFCAGAATTASN